MPTLLPMVHVKRYKDRHGKVRHYFRKRGMKSASLPGEPGSAEFMAAYQAAAAGERRSVVSSNVIAGSFEALFVAYYASREFRGLKSQTQADYRSTLRDFEKRVAALPVAGKNGFKQGHLERYLDLRADTPGAAAKFLKRFRAVMAFAVRREWRPDNPTTGVRFSRKATGGFPDWTEAELALYAEKWPLASKERLAFALALYTGQRKSDVLKMGPQHVHGDKITVRQQKTGKLLRIQLHPALKTVLDAAPARHMTFIVTEYGAPFSEKAFGAWFKKRVTAAGIEGKTMHGLRKAAARRLAEAGCTIHQIAAVTGHASLKELEVYTRDVDQTRLATEAIRKVSGTDGV